MTPVAPAMAAALTDERRVGSLVNTFALCPFERDVVLLALAPELDGHHDRPTVDRALALFCQSDAERRHARSFFDAAAPLMATPLLTVSDAEHAQPLTTRVLRLEERIVEFLLGGDRLDAQLSSPQAIAGWMPAGPPLDDVWMPADVKATLTRIAIGGGVRSCLLAGPVASGKRLAAAAVCRLAGRPLLVCQGTGLAARKESAPSLLRRCCREAALYGGALYVDDWDTAAREGGAALGYELRRAGVLIFLGSTSWDASLALDATTIPVRVPLPSTHERAGLWRRRLDAAGATSIDAATLAAAFRFAPGRIDRAIGAASARARAAGRTLTEDAVQGACRDESAARIANCARRTVPARVWDDLIVTADVAERLRELCDQARHRLTVLGEWGFERRLSLGKGLIALFSGLSGTGKTLAAEIVGGDLGLDLYRIDVSAVVSKYIGETEKNLARVFDAAQDSSAVLLFDEADALFGKRSEVKDAHDRYANIEVDFLLQRLEEYEGIVILTSNMTRNIDQAFLRRMHVVIEFPVPDERHRQRIWQSIFPPQAPLDPSVDFALLARQFKLPGGSIRNAALAAAFRAAANGGVIDMRHLTHASRREYQKLGKVCDD